MKIKTNCRVATINTPEGTTLRLASTGSAVTIVNHDGQSLTFAAQLIPEVRGVLLDFEYAYWNSLEGYGAEAMGDA